MGFFSKFGRTKHKEDRSVNTLEALELSLNEFNINSMFNDVVNASEAISSAKGIDLIFETASDVPAKVISDRLLLGEVLLNLLDNAIAFTDKGEVRLNVTRLENKDEKVRLRFDVIDTGVGIHPDALHDILIPFLKGDIESLSVFDLEGKGLYRAREIVKKMQGTLSVQSTEDKGTTFSAEVLLNAVNVNEKRHYRLPSTAALSLKILILEDNEKQAQALKKFLEYFRHDVEIVEEKQKDLLKRGTCDILFISEKLMKQKLVEQVLLYKSKVACAFVLVEDMLRPVKNDKVALSIADHLIFKPYNQQTIFELLVNLYGEDASEKNEEKEIGTQTMSGNKKETDLKKRNQIFVVKDGMQRAGNDKKYFLKVLDNYLAMYDDSEDILLSLIKRRKYSALEKYSRELKGILANIGAYKLSNIVLKLEKASKTENLDESQKWIQWYQQECTETLQEIDNFRIHAMSKEH
ncbi:MAG: hypothetical protein DRG24_01480 [Epsilonproteobacteria bacterium]|nr:MAG: hypothetical protein DRG24_01480 [Campylobacterota bacterium]